jgi:hypothetical protein
VSTATLLHGGNRSASQGAVGYVPVGHFCNADSVHKAQRLPLQTCVVVGCKKLMTFYLSIEPGPHADVVNKYAMVDCGLFGSTIRTDLAPIVFEYPDWAFVRARSAAEHPQAEPVQYLHT